MASDIYYDNVVLLLHCDGTDGSTTFTDDSPSQKTVTAYGDAHIETDQSKFGGASAYFDGSGDYLSAGTSTDYDFGSGDMTIELWFRSTAVNDSTTFLSREWVGAPWSGGFTFQMRGDYNGGMRVWMADYATGSPLMTGTTTTHGDGQWHHAAWTKEGNVHRLFLDGVLEATATTSAAFSAVSKNINIGSDQTFGGRYFPGYLDDIRITKGVARYTSNFTPPTEAFPDGSAPVTSLVLSAFAPSSPGQIETVAFSLQAFSVGLSAVYPPKSDLALSSYPVSLDGVLLPSAIEFRHAPLVPWVMPMTSPVYPPVSALALEQPVPEVSIHGLWPPQAMLFGWEYDEGTDTISIPVSTFFELENGQADPVSGDWRAVVLSLINSMWDSYIELDTPPQAVQLEYSPGYMMTFGPFAGAVKVEYSATTYLNFPEKTLADEP